MCRQPEAFEIKRIRNIRRQIGRQLASNLASPILDVKLDAKTIIIENIFYDLPDDNVTMRNLQSHN